MTSSRCSDVQALCQLIGEGADLLTFFTTLTAHAVTWTGSDHADVVLDDVLVRRHVRGSADSEVVHSLPEDDTATRWILEQGKPLTVENAAEPGLSNVSEDDYTAYLGVPIFAEGRTRGALYIRSKDSRTFSEAETEQVQSLAALAGLAVNQQVLNSPRRRASTARWCVLPSPTH